MQDTMTRYTDPVQLVMVDAFRKVPHLKTSLLTNYVMGHLPGSVPDWAVKDLRRGISARVQSELRREFVWEDRHGEKQRTRVFVPVNGYHRRFTGLTVDEYRHYIEGLEQSNRYDRARIAFHKRQLKDIEGHSNGTDIGDLLGIEDAA